MTVPAEIAAAYRAGRSSRTDGVTANPYVVPAGESTPRDRSLAAAWQRGRQHTSPRRAAFDDLARLDEAVTE